VVTHVANAAVVLMLFIKSLVSAAFASVKWRIVVSYLELQKQAGNKF
jgi:hypothetical protein